jgi:RHS repeat-associated protein
VAWRCPSATPGQQTDGYALIYLRARYYDPSTGRFLSRDTVAGSVAEPRTLSRYGYALNNPLALTRRTFSKGAQRPRPVPGSFLISTI